MRHFKLPLIVTGVAVVVALIVGIALVTSIQRSQDSSQQKQERAQQAGGTVAIGLLFVVTPFWILAAGKVGKERREARTRAKGGQKQVRR